MEWTTGTASLGTGGFGGIPATVGVKRGDGVEFFLVGLFDQNSSVYDGPGVNNDGVNFLDDKLYFFNVCLPSGGLNNIPPTVEYNNNNPGFIPCEPVVVCGVTPVTIEFDFNPVEITQTISSVVVSSSSPSLVFTTPIITSFPNPSDPSGVGTISHVVTQVDALSTPPGTYTLSFTATDDGTPALPSTVEFTIVQTTPTPVITDNGPLCEGTTLNLSATSTITSSSLTYQWSGPNLFSSTLQNPTVPNVLSSLNAGDYTCQVFVNSCPSLIATTTVAVIPNPPTPTVTPTGPVTLCAGDNLALTTPLDPTISNYEWTKISSPGIVLSSTNSLNITSITTGQAGQYSLRVKSGVCWSLPLIIDVVVKPIPTIPAFTPINVCSGDVLNLIGPAPAPSPSVTEYAWSGPNSFLGITQDVLVTSNATQTEEGPYSLIYTVNGCSSASGSVTVDVIALPTSDAGSDLPVCSGVPLSIGNSTLPATNAYSWSPTAGLNSSTIPNPILELPNFSNLPYVATYTVTTSITVSSTTCSSQDNVVVTINPQPNGTFEIPESQCFNDNSFDFVASGNYSSAATFDWDFGPWANVPAANVENPQDISFNATGNQLIRFTVSENGCESYPYQASVMVHKMPVANFSADTLFGCSPMVVNFSNESESDDPFKTKEWTILGETIISNTDPTIVFDKPGAYDISLKVTTVYGCEDTWFIPNFINVYPSPRADFLLSPEIAQITDPEIEFIDLSSDADNIFYEVTLSSGPDIINQSQPTYTFPDVGLYDVRQVVSNQFGQFSCVDSLTKQAVVELGYKYFIPAGFSPNGDGLNDYFKVSGEDVIDFSMIVYNRWGQKLYQSFDMDNGWDGKTKLGDEVVDGGVYFYRVEMTQRNGLKNTIEGHVQIIK
jgi:gliding motility-associated-like protein